MSICGVPRRLQRREAGRQPHRRPCRHGWQRRLCRNGWRRNWRPVGHSHQHRASRLRSRRQCRLRVRYRPVGRTDLYRGGYFYGVCVLGAHWVARRRRAGRVRSRRQRKVLLPHWAAGSPDMHVGGHVRGVRVLGVYGGRWGRRRQRWRRHQLARRSRSRRWQRRALCNGRRGWQRRPDCKGWGKCHRRARGNGRRGWQRRPDCKGWGKCHRRARGDGRRGCRRRAICHRRHGCGRHNGFKHNACDRQFHCLARSDFSRSKRHTQLDGDWRDNPSHRSRRWFGVGQDLPSCCTHPDHYLHANIERLHIGTSDGGIDGSGAGRSFRTDGQHERGKGWTHSDLVAKREGAHCRRGLG